MFTRFEFDGDYTANEYCLRKEEGGGRRMDIHICDYNFNENEDEDDDVNIPNGLEREKKQFIV